MNNLSFDYFQHLAKGFAIYKETLNDDNKVIYPVLGLVSESGEVADKIKKIMRDTNIPLKDLSMETKVEIMKRHKLERSALDIANLIIEKKGEINSERMKVLLESLSYRQELNVKREMLKEAKARELYLYTVTVLLFFLVLLFSIYFT